MVTRRSNEESEKFQNVTEGTFRSCDKLKKYARQDTVQQVDDHSSYENKNRRKAFGLCESSQILEIELKVSKTIFLFRKVLQIVARRLFNNLEHRKWLRCFLRIQHVGKSLKSES